MDFCPHGGASAPETETKFGSLWKLAKICNFLFSQQMGLKKKITHTHKKLSLWMLTNVGIFKREKSKCEILNVAS